MTRLLLAFAASAAFVSAATAQGVVVRVPGQPPRLSSDEIRDYQQDQTDRRHEMERDALRMDQKAELRARGLDDDDD